MKIFAFCKPYLSMHKQRIALIVVLFVIKSALAIIAPYITGDFIDQILASNTSVIYQYCAALIIITIATMLIRYTSTIMYTKIQTTLTFSMNEDIVSKVQQQSLSSFNAVDSAYLTQIITQDSSAIMSFCLSIIQNVFVNAFSLLVSLFIVMRINVWIGLTILILSIFYAIVYTKFRKPLSDKTKLLKEAQSKFYAKLHEQVTNTGFIKIFSLSNEFVANVNESFIYKLKNQLDYQKISFLYTSSETVITLIAQIALFAIGGISIVHNTMTVGEFTIISSYYRRIITSTQFFYQIGKNYQDALVSYNRIQGIITTPCETTGEEIVGSIDKIVAKNLSFSYGFNSLIHDFNAELSKGNITAITGDNGKGKTTLIHLFIGMYIDEFTGSIIYDTKNIKDIDMGYVRRNLVGVSMQNPVFMNNTVAFNLLYKEPTNTDVLFIEKLIREIGFDDLFSTLINGLYTVISEDATNLSGGQKQKISILRAVIKNPHVLILDEPFNALDTKSRESLALYLEKQKKDSIIILISHDDRLTSISDVTYTLG